MGRKNRKELLAEQLLVRFVTHDVPLSPEFRHYAQANLNSLRRIFSNMQEAEIETRKERGRFVVEVTLKVARYLLRAQERANSVRTAFDQAMNKIDRQLHRYKERLIDRRRHSKPVVPPPVFGKVPTLSSIPTIGRVKRFPVKPMTVDEAAMQMDLLGHDFFVFINAKTNKVNVLYRRRVGDLGLLEPGEDEE